MKVEVAITFELWGNASVTPGRPAPQCSNPDHAAYGDPGDPPECEIGDVGIDTGPPLTDEQVAALDVLFPDWRERMDEAAFAEADRLSE